MAPIDERPSKRARQACEPCRRKKSRYPGEKPTCSYCERLGQKCVYAGEAAEEGSDFAKNMEGRVSSIERKFEQLIDYITGSQQSPAEAGTSDTRNIPTYSPANFAPLLNQRAFTDDSQDLSAVQLYLTFCNSQPLPLFPQGISAKSLCNRDSELVHSIEALGLRFKATAS
ncbi:hypothetical protein N7486_006471 [Penicillium sp. IBT 16267x]|nr:hypothetical protein N7486_006471 [Penicillium sp. IBT 16267x]